MTRKDYIAIAKLIADDKYMPREAKTKFVNHLALILKRENARFVPSKFINACFPDKE